MRPSLIDVPRSNAEGLGDAVVVDAERPADVDGDAVDLVARSPPSARAALNAFAASFSWLSGRNRPNSLTPTAGDRGLVANGESHALAVGPQQDPTGGSSSLRRARAPRWPPRAAATGRRSPSPVRASSARARPRAGCARFWLPREHRLVLEEGCTERHELAGELPDQDPAPGNPEAAAHRLEERRDVVKPSTPRPSVSFFTRSRSPRRARVTTHCVRARLPDEIAPCPAEVVCAIT